MPIYDFKCESCGEPFEAFYRISEYEEAKTKKTIACPHCNSSEVVRTPTLVAVHGAG